MPLARQSHPALVVSLEQSLIRLTGHLRNQPAQRRRSIAQSSQILLLITLQFNFQISHDLLVLLGGLLAMRIAGVHALIMIDEQLDDISGTPKSDRVVKRSSFLMVEPHGV